MMGLGEFEIIRRYFSRPARRRDVVLGVGDDAALLAPPPDHELVAAVDSVQVDVHFPRQLSAADLGHRALAVNLSDLAAMAAEPAWMLLSLSLEQARADWLEAFASGLYGLAERYRVALVGGDTVHGPLAVTITVLGFVPSGRALRRSGARAGDQVWVSGRPGEAAAGLALLQRRLQAPAAASRLIERFCRPEPRIALGRWLGECASAAIDISDGLYADLDKLAAASGVCAVLDADRLPASPDLLTAVGEQQARELALGGGDDYELCFTAPPTAAAEIQKTAAANGWELTRVGDIVAGRGVRLVQGGRDLPAPAGYEHFAD